MSLKPTLHLPWLEFIKLDSISSLPLREQSEVFKKMTDGSSFVSGKSMSKPFTKKESSGEKVPF